MNKIIVVSALVLFSFVLNGCNSQANLQTEKLKDNVLTQESGEISKNINLSKAEKIEIIDFHGTRRCSSCETIEKFTVSTLEEFFQKEMRDGKISFQSINGELSENYDIVVKYQARGSSLFMNIIRDGKDNIEEDVEVWRLVGDEDKFKSYLKNKIDNILN